MINEITQRCVAELRRRCNLSHDEFQNIIQKHMDEAVETAINQYQQAELWKPKEPAEQMEATPEVFTNIWAANMEEKVKNLRQDHDCAISELARRVEKLEMKVYRNGR